MDGGTNIPPIKDLPVDVDMDSSQGRYPLRKRIRDDYNDGFIKPPKKQTFNPNSLKKISPGTSVKNRYSNLSGDDEETFPSTQDPSLTSISTSNNAKKANIRPKPVFVSSTILAIKNSLLNIPFSTPPLLKMMNQGKTQVLCETNDDKTKLIDKLRDLKFSYFTFTESHQKSMLYVLKGHYHVTCEELKAEMEEANVPATKVSFLWNNKERPIYIVHFVRGTTNLHALNTMAKAIGNVIVKWQRFEPTRKRLTQCHNCQQYGHSATNCGHKYRCVKCLNDHLPGQCQRKSKDDEGTPKCVNCQGDHAASSRQCHSYISYSEMIQKQRTSRQAPSKHFVSNRQQQGHPAQQASPAAAVAFLNRAHFPNLPNVNNVQNVNTNLNVLSSETPTFTKISSLQARLTAIPDMSEVLLKFEALVLDLESANTVDEKFHIVMKHCLHQNEY